MKLHTYVQRLASDDDDGLAVGAYGSVVELGRDSDDEVEEDYFLVRTMR